jgi:hypothetical protein
MWAQQSGARRMRPILVMAMLTLISACQFALPGNKSDVPNAVTGDPIEVTSLDAPVEGLAAAETTAAESPDASAPEPEVAQTDPAEVEETPPVEATPPVEVIDPVQQTPAALACKKKGGSFLSVGGSSIAHACVTPTRDGGDRCERGTQCDGECLARTGTCAPVTPLYGCTEVFQDNGNRVTTCIE